MPDPRDPPDRPGRPVIPVSRSGKIPAESSFPEEVLVNLTRRTMIPEEGSGAPPIPAELKSARTPNLRPANITNAPPLAPPVRQRISLRPRPRLVEDPRSVPWLQSPFPLGMPVAAGGRMVSVVIAAQVVNFFAIAEEGVTIVEVDLVFAPVIPGKIEADWMIRYTQNNGQLRKALNTALMMGFSRVPLWPGLVIRFVGGPPMSEADARANRYHFWPNESRSPTRVEIEDRFVDAAREEAEGAFRDAQQAMFTRLTVAWWKQRKDQSRYRSYLLGKLLVERDDPVELEKRELEALKTALSEHVGLVIDRLSAVVFGEDLKAAAALKEKGRAPVTPTVVGERRPTFMEYEADLPEGAIAPLDGKS